MDAYSKFQNHIESSFYLTEMALPNKELSETINSMRVKNEITNKFDDKVYKDLKELVDNLSYSEYFAYRKKDLQSEFGVGDRTIQRDLEALRVHGFEFKTKNGITHATALGGGAF